MTSEQETLFVLLRHLDDLGIPYMVSGSLASSYHGRPRSTHDADVIVDPNTEQLAALVQRLLDGGFYVDARRAHDSLLLRSQFNAVDPHSGFKLDLIVRKSRPFSQEEFARRQRVELSAGVNAVVSSAEDTILAKLEWSRKAGRSERQIEDAAGVLAVNPGLDRAYVERWARELGVLDLWQEILGRVTPSL